MYLGSQKCHTVPEMASFKHTIKSKKIYHILLEHINVSLQEMSVKPKTHNGSMKNTKMLGIPGNIHHFEMEPLEMVYEKDLENRQKDDV